MATAFYDEALLPCITYPMENVHTKSKRYLGNVALTGKVYATINMVAKTDSDMDNLHIFWRVDCNYGLDPFIIAIPIFGMPTSSLDILCQWVGDFTPTKVDTHWTIKQKLKILSPIQVVKDDVGDYVRDDNGNYIYTDISLHTTTDNIISYITVTNFVI